MSTVWVWLEGGLRKVYIDALQNLLKVVRKRPELGPRVVTEETMLWFVQNENHEGSIKKPLSVRVVCASLSYMNCPELVQCVPSPLGKPHSGLPGLFKTWLWPTYILACLSTVYLFLAPGVDY